MYQKNEILNYGLSESVIKSIISVLEIFSEINEVILFGSRALGSYKEGSDIDLALKGNLNNGLLLKIKTEIDDLDLPYFTDILDYNKLKEQELIKHIDEFGIIIYTGNEK